MASLREILSAHAPVLLIDAASARIQTGVFGADGVGRWKTSDEESGTGIFRCIEALALDPGQVAAFVFCHGPGSILGIRTAAMALRTWCVLRPRPVFAYSSLELVLACCDSTARPHVIADARRGAWHVASPGQPLRRLPAGELPGNLVMPEGFRHWSPLPSDTRAVSYCLADLFPTVLDADLLHPMPSPDAFLHEEPDYKTWTPQIHRAP